MSGRRCLPIVVCLASLASPVSAREGRARVAVVQQAESFAAGVTGFAVVDVTNTEAREWPATSAVYLVGRWLDVAGRPVPTAAEPARTRAPSAVAPGETVRLCAVTVVPSRPGPYLLEWALAGAQDVPFGEPETVIRRRVDVQKPHAEAGEALRVFIWLLLTLAHVAAATWAAARVVKRARPAVEELFYTAGLFASGVLIAALLFASATVGLSLLTGGCSLALGDLVLLLIAYRTGPAGVAAPADDVSPEDSWERVAGWVGSGVLLAVCIHWFVAAAAGSGVRGTDAAHYHVPHAVNLALGASPFGLLPTPHLYPMNTSLLAAWFLLPVRDPLIVDLALLLPFLLLTGSLAWLFRSGTGRSGLAWTPWFILLLFCAPLLRASAWPSADLPYAAAFVAALAQLMAVCSARVVTRLDLARLGLASGLLLGAKISGLPALAVLVVTFGVAWGVLRVRWRGPSRRIALGGAMALLLATLTGGFWLVRNWVNYESPVAPMGIHLRGLTIAPGPRWEDYRLHRSVAGDFQDPTYRVLPRMHAFASQWLGPAYIPLLLPLLIVPVELAARRRAKAREAPIAPWQSARRVLWLAVMVITLALLWTTASLPWTSLESTGGFSLRFVLPVVILLPFLAFVSIFSPHVRWDERAFLTRTMLGVLAVVSVVTFARLQARAGDPEDLLGFDWVPTSLAAVATTMAAVVMRIGSRRVAAAVSLGALVCAAANGARVVTARHAGTLAADRMALERLESCFGEAAGIAIDDQRGVLLHARRAEAAAGLTCTRRRFFVGARLDEPLALQPATLSSLVFDARRPGADFFDGGAQFAKGAAFVRDAVEREAPGHRPGWCDYVVVGPDAPEPEALSGVMRRLRAKGLLQPAGRSGRYTVYLAGQANRSTR